LLVISCWLRNGVRQTGVKMPVPTYRDLRVWQRSMDMVVAVYRATVKFPREELYGLTGQLRRAAVSVPSNIAEGQGRGIGNEFSHHVRIVQGSLQEMETQLILAERLEYLRSQDVAPIMELAAEVGRLNRGLHKSIV
jgi:four helix bundle protein